MEELYNQLSKLPKEYLELFILNLMREDKINFADLSKIHVKYLEELKKFETKKLMTLRGKVIGLWCGTKKEMPQKLVSLMQEGMNEGWVNITQEQIDKSKWNKPL